MAGFSYLWTNRARFTFGSKKFFRAWGKRFFSLSELIARNYRRFQLVLQGAKLHETAEIGTVRIDGDKNKLSIGPYSFVGRIYMALHEKIEIGERVCINDGVEILTASHDVADPLWRHTTGKVVIEDYVWIGTGAMILPDVHIGQGAVIGARAVVTKSVLPGAIVVGNPAKPLSKMRCKDLNYNPCEFLAANRAWLVG